MSRCFALLPSRPAETQLLTDKFDVILNGSDAVTFTFRTGACVCNVCDSALRYCAISAYSIVIVLLLKIYNYYRINPAIVHENSIAIMLSYYISLS